MQQWRFGICLLMAIAFGSASLMFLLIGCLVLTIPSYVESFVGFFAAAMNFGIAYVFFRFRRAAKPAVDPIQD